ncbi:UPF0739 protein C1orf74 homolog [Gouania willdenowi]|uniref:Uncharacterized protein n=1 Tax=Gouania willdenowi TaxID=441366 RepID=A0A8C5HJF0_GOUWI|nr:UPF0739 protein C1orf74 homolog [Gouania willdenowi]
MTSTQELFVSAARRFLCACRKSLSVSQSVALAAQVTAVDLGLKPALLYDSNAACTGQLHEYIRSLQSIQLLSESLLTLDLNGNSLIVNVDTVKSNFRHIVQGNSVAVVNICHILEKPIILSPKRKELQSVVEELIRLLGAPEAGEPLYVGDKCEQWNLCTVFGLLLGYPVTYWFDQTESFENCLSMTPLEVISASVTWRPGSTDHRCCLYSFSVPAVLHEETQPTVGQWKLHLQERFDQQHLLQDLSISQSIVTLPSVCL